MAKQPPRIFVSTAPFSAVDSKPMKLLQETGWEIRVNPLGRKLTPSETATFAHDCDGIIAGTENLHELIADNRHLKIICRVGIGLDSVPLEVCRQKGIRVTYTPDAMTAAVAEMTVGIMITVARGITAADRGLRAGIWNRHQGKRIGESVIGIIGLGRIGTAVAKLLPSFHPKLVLTHDCKDMSGKIEALKNQTGLSIEAVSLQQIISSSDVLTLHVPLTGATRHLIGAREISAMKSSAFLINAARGGIVDEVALHDALRSGFIAGAAVDAFEHEPYMGPLRDLGNILLTPHIGSCSVDCRAKMELEATQEIVNFFRGLPLRGEVPDEEYEYQVSSK